MVKFQLREVNISLAKLFNLLIINNVLLGRVLDHRPLQQGLRLVYSEAGVFFICTRPSSTITRIKTRVRALMLYLQIVY